MVVDPEFVEDCFDRYGEDPRRFLDADLMNDSDARRLAIARIRGIERHGVLTAFEQVEKQMERGPREKVLGLLQARREYLLEHGERGDWERRDPEAIPDVSRPTVFLDANGEPRDRSKSATAKVSRMRADGGEE